MTLLLNERNDLINLVVNSIRRDLVEIHNELWNCMALHAVANIGGREMGEALGPDVYRLLVSPYITLLYRVNLVGLRSRL